MNSSRLSTLPAFMLGTSYMTLGKSVRMWQEWDEERVRKDFDIMRGMGVNTVKMYIFWDFFFPSPDEGLNPMALSEMDTLCEIAREREIGLIVDLVIGHMSGENYTAAWTEGKDLMKNPTALRGQAEYIQAFTTRYRNERAIIMWDVCSEISLYRMGREGCDAAYPALFDATIGVLGEPPRQDESWLWLKTLTEAARQGDGSRPVYSGVGTARGFALKDVASLSDLNACYAYNWGASDVCSSYLCGFERALSQAYQLPCLVEEFGTSKSWNSPRYEAGYYRNVLYSSLLNGCVGALSWQFGSYEDIEEKDPYLYHAWEIQFGMVQSDGTEYPCADIMREFSAFLRSGILQNMKCPDPDLYVMLCDTYDQAHAFNSAGQQSERVQYYELYRRLRDAGLNVAFIREDADWAEAHYLLVPNAGSSKLKSTTWRKMEWYVREGGHLLVETEGYPGAQNFSTLFGTDVLMSIEYPCCMLTGIGGGQSFGKYAIEQKVRLLLTEPGSAEVLVQSGEGIPVLLRNRMGEGEVSLLTVPLAKLSGRRISAWNDEYQAVYARLRDIVGITPQASADSANIEAGVLIKEQGDERLLLLINHRPLGVAEGKLRLGFDAQTAIDLDAKVPMIINKDENGCYLDYRVEAGSVLKVLIRSKET